jgi:hypothetical protein
VTTKEPKVEIEFETISAAPGAGTRDGNQLALSNLAIEGSGTDQGQIL